MVVTNCGNCERTNKAHYQDVLHGQWRRVFNPTKPKIPNERYHKCTVCDTEVSFTAVASRSTENEGRKKRPTKVPTGKNPVKKSNR